jgi:hypothetical protein
VVQLTAADSSPTASRTLGAATALCLAAVDLRYGTTGRISKVYLLDAAVELAWVAVWIPAYGDTSKAPRGDLPGPEGGTLLQSSRSGFVPTVAPERLVAAAREQGVFLRLGGRPGDHVVAGAPIASAWLVERKGNLPPDAVDGALAQAVEIGFERTVEQDAALGLRQLTTSP